MLISDKLQIRLRGSSINTALITENFVVTSWVDVCYQGSIVENIEKYKQIREGAMIIFSSE